MGGILSSDQEENPHFAAANHVLVPYCSSDSWSGTARPDPRAGQRFAFLGAEIVAEVVRELVSWEQLGRARELYLTGSSAGGTGVLVNLDQVRRNTGLYYKSITLLSLLCTFTLLSAKQTCNP